MAESSGDDGGRAARVELTERQREVLRLIVAGKTNPEIGEALGISLDGAKWHVREIMAKLDVSTREEAGEWWLAHEGLGSRVARALRAIVPASLWLRVGLGVAVAGGGAAVVVGAVVLGGLRDSHEGAGASATAATRHVTGTIKSYTAATYSAPMVESSPGVVVLTDGTSFQLGLHTGIAFPQQPIAFADLEVGDVVSVTARRTGDASLFALHVDLFMEPLGSAAAAGPSAGQSLQPDGALHVLGSISARDATSFQLAYPGGAATVLCGASCLVTKIITDKSPELEPGDRITATVTNGVADSIRFVQ